MSNIRSLHDEGDDSPDEKKGTTSFAGGEKSALAIQNSPDDSPWKNAQQSGLPPPGSRKVTLYRNGFKIDDGELRLFDDPANKQFMEELKQGYAPQELREGATGPVHIIMDDRRNETIEPPPTPKYTLFSGAGQMLRGARRAPPSSSSAAASTISQAPLSINDNEPTTTIQIRFHNGERITQKFNQTNTINDLYRYVQQCAPGACQLLTGFPPKAITDKSLTLKAAGLLNASVTQKLV